MNIFFNTFRGSQIEEGLSLNFKSDDYSELSIAQVREKVSETCTLQRCIKQLGESENHQTRYDEAKKVRENVLSDVSNHILLAIW